MTLALQTEITFYPLKGLPFKVQKVSAIEIESSWKMLTDTATIVLPRNVGDFDKQKVRDLFKVGDKVSIKMGDNGTLVEEFTGYITQVSADFPIRLTLSDEMWKLRQLPVNYAASSVTLKKFLTDIVKSLPINTDADVPLGAVRFSKTTLGAVLDKLQKEWAIYSFIREGKLTVAKPYSEVSKPNEYHTFDLERNCTDNSLKYLSKEERTVKIVGTATHGKGNKLKAEYGDENPVTTINMSWNVSTQEELDKEVRRLYELSKHEGFEGTFTTYGIPSVQHGQKVKITSTLYPDRHGTYYVDRVKKTLEASQYRQEIEIGVRAAQATNP